VLVEACEPHEGRKTEEPKMPNELFRMLNVRPPRPANVISIDDVAGKPGIIAAITPQADQRILTRDSLGEIITPAAQAIDGDQLAQAGVTQLGAMLEEWQPGAPVQPLRAAAANINLGDQNLRNVLQLAANAWLANVLSRSTLGNTITEANTLGNVRRALRGAALARQLQALGDDENAEDTVRKVSRSPLAVRDPIGIPAALRSAERPEELDERRQAAAARDAERPTAAERYHMADRLLRKVIDAHGTFGDRNQQTILGAEEIPAVASATGQPGLFSRLGAFLFGEQTEGPTPQVRRANALNREVVGDLFDDSLTNEERESARRVFGPNYRVTVQNLNQAVRGLNDFQQAALAEAQKGSAFPSLTSPPGPIIDERPPIFLPGFIAGLRVAGIGDLIVARESLKRYEAEEIAHIENILPLEERVRQHRTVRSSESIVERETEEETEKEKDLRTSERFELQSESERTIETQFGIDFGLNVSATYGFVNGSITVDANLGINYNRSVTETERNASSFSNEVVNHSLDRIRKRARELRRVTLTETVDELNRHAITGLAVPFSGIYKWVNKVQEVELRHFGQRLMIEFYIPEPALRLLRSAKVPDIEAPPHIDFGPETIDIDNYQQRARLFEASAVNPPPPYNVVVESAFAHQPRAAQGDVPLTKRWSHTEVKDSLPIPAGYGPTHASAIVLSSKAHDYISASVAVAGKSILGGTYQSGYDSGLVALNTSAPRGDNGVAIAYTLYDFAQFEGVDAAALHVSVLCQRQVEAWQAWQLDCYEKYRLGNQQQWSNYREAQIAQAATSGVRISGRNPLENRIIERDELKRWSIEVMRGRPFDFNAINETGPEPAIAYDRLDGNRNINLFLEKGFEWTQMTYWLFPYFWGRREQWADRLALEDADKLHQNFLRAGSARVLVPVTPGYEERVLYYIHTAGWEDQRVIWLPETDPQFQNPLSGVPPVTANPDIWMEVILSKNKELAYGSGTLTVTNGSADGSINADSSWELDDTDIGRELYIEGFPYAIVARAGTRNFTLDKDYAQADNARAHYLVSSLRVGAPWEVVIPTNLVVLADQAHKLNVNENVNVIAPDQIAWLPASAAPTDGAVPAPDDQ